MIPILGSNDVIRKSVVKTNLAFIRLKSAKDKRVIESSKVDAAPYLRFILERVLPDLIILAGVRLHDFGSRHCAEVVELEKRQAEQSVGQTVLHPARVRLSGGHSCLVVEVAHASQFSWIYDKYNVPSKIKALLNNEHTRLTIPAHDVAPQSVGSLPFAAGTRSDPLPQQRGGTQLSYAAAAIGRPGVGAIRRPQVNAVGSEDTKPILKELVRLGLDDDTYRTYLHHSRHSIARMLAYEALTYKAGSRNLILHRKLEWMLCVCRNRNLQSGSTNELRELAIATTKNSWKPNC
jgi:hypothetical protein